MTAHKRLSHIRARQPSAKVSAIETVTCGGGINNGTGRRVALLDGCVKRQRSFCPAFQCSLGIQIKKPEQRGVLGLVEQCHFVID